MKKITNLINKCLQTILLVTCVYSLGMGLYAMGNGVWDSGTYFSAAASALAGLMLTLIPNFLIHKDIMVMPAIIQTAFTIFVFCAMFGGDVLDFYNRISWWDSFLHLSSGILFSMTGYLLFISLNRNADARNQLNPLSIVLFSFCFALACGAIWEIYEFACDCFFGINMQRWQNAMPVEQWVSMQNVSNFSQPGLIDTMKDIITDTIGALVSIPILLAMIRRDNRYVKTKITIKEPLVTEWAPIPSAMNAGLAIEDKSNEQEMPYAS